MILATPNPTLAAFDSGGSGPGTDTYAKVIGLDWSGPGAACATVVGRLRTRPA